MFKLVIQDDEGKTTVVPLIRDEITIGRKEGNTIRLTERNVSRRHARILRSDNDVQIEDLGSYNGIRVNNARIAERVSLRISDQVQIGDYKLYLKAEGIEQVDDARTMPIERIDNSTSPEGVMVPSPPPAGATVLPTAPMPAQRVAPMAVADTDPAGRPVATPAQVAALTAPAGYGKFVVLSSNFAGKELQLSRPQMIIGRTDENDLVINHRSISRNHAKVTRDPETQRYTISDLQSSNGVRVNGQDYGKVELRRADVVDLGHVRMRFVEPGEDFVFSRDAVVNDVPEAGGRKGMLVAVVLAIVVLGGVGAFFVLKNNSGDSNTHGTVEPGGSGTSVATVGSGSSALAITVEPDAGTPAIAIGSGDSPELKRFEGDCLGDITDKKWSDLETCADQLDSIKRGSGLQYRNKAKLEIGAQGELEGMQGELKNKNLKSAQKHLDKIPSDSVYNAEALKELNDKRAAITSEAIGHAKLLAKQHDCDKLDKYVVQEGSALGDDVGAAISAAVKCEAAPVNVAPPPTDCSAALLNSKDARCKQQFCATHDTNVACRSAEVVPAVSCESLVSQGDSFVAAGDHATALKTYEQAYKCKSDPHTLSLTFMAACNAGNVAHAKTWWKKLPPEQQNRLSVMCIRNHITRDQLDAP